MSYPALDKIENMGLLDKFKEYLSENIPNFREKRHPDNISRIKCENGKYLVQKHLIYCGIDKWDTVYECRTKNTANKKLELLKNELYDKMMWNLNVVASRWLDRQR
jgi:hypothetical protein